MLPRDLGHRSVAIAGLCWCLAAACQEGPTAAEESVRIVLSDSAITLRALGEIRIVTAELRTLSGGYPPVSADDGSSYYWESSDTLVARVSHFSDHYDYEGRITAIGPGRAEILVRKGRLAPARLEIEVTQSLVSVEVVPSHIYLEGAGARTTLRAVPRDSLRHEVAGLSARWELEADGVATLSAEGVLTAVGTGSGLIRATVDSVSSAPALLEVLVGTPVAPARARTLAVTWASTCGIAVGGDAYCWGAGTIGSNPAADSALPVRVAEGLHLSAFSSSYGFVCAMTEEGDSYCWGETLLRSLPVPTLVASNVVTAGLVGAGYRCSRTRRNYCSAEPYLFRLQSDRSLYSLLERSPGFTAMMPFVSLSVGYSEACGIVPNGSVYCWPIDLEYTRDLSENAFGSRAFTEVSVSGSGRFVCAIAADGTARCRAFRACAALIACVTRGWLGDGTVAWQTAPVEVAGGLRFTTISAGDQFSCGVTTAGAAFCWGQNDSGQLGDGSTTDRLVPVPVAGGLTFATIAAGVSHACGVTTDGAAYCWGDNGRGQLGDGTRQARLVPTAVGGGIVFRVPSP